MPGRACAICGKMGGSAMTLALRFVGIRDKTYAHADCINRRKRRILIERGAIAKARGEA